MRTRASLSCTLFVPLLELTRVTYVQALLALPSNIGVTATLELAYKKPTFADQFVVIRAELKELKGRKAWVEGRIEDLNGEVLVEGK